MTASTFTSPPLNVSPLPLRYIYISHSPTQSLTQPASPVEIYSSIHPAGSAKALVDVMSSFKRHIPYLPYHKSIIREICTPQKDDLLIIAKGLGMRRVSWQEGPSRAKAWSTVTDNQIICALLKTYDRKEDLILVVSLLSPTIGPGADRQVNATPSDEAGIGDELGIMGVRDPGFRVLTYEMNTQQR